MTGSWEEIDPALREKFAETLDLMPVDPETVWAGMSDHDRLRVARSLERTPQETADGFLVSVTPDEFEALVARMSGDELSHLGASLQERAKIRRLPISETQARSAIDNAPLTPGRLPTAPGRVRAAARLLVQQRWEPEQITPVMVTVAHDYLNEAGWMHPDYPEVNADIIREAVASGIADALFEREGGHVA